MKLEDLPEIYPKDAHVASNEKKSVQEPTFADLHATKIPKTAKHAKVPSTDAGASFKKKSHGKKVGIIVGICLCVLIGAGTVFAITNHAGKKETEQTPVAPKFVQATVKPNGLFVVYKTLQRGDVLTNVQEASELNSAYVNDYYRATLNDKTIYIKKDSVRLSNETVPEEWTGYADENAIIYKKSDFTGEEILSLLLNEEVTVLDSFGDLLYVRNADGFEGYVPVDKIMHEKKEEEQSDAASSANNNSYSYSGNYYGGSGSSNAGGGGGSAGGGSAPSIPPSSGSGNSGSQTPPEGSADGDEMVMPASFHWGEPTTAEYAYADESSKLTATVLLSDVPAYFGILDRGDKVEIKVDDLFDFNGKEKQDNMCTVRFHNKECELPEELFRLDSEPAYQPWIGYAAAGSVLYQDYTLTTVFRNLETNTELTIIDSIGSILIVESDESLFYIDGEQVLKEATETETETSAQVKKPRGAGDDPAPRKSNTTSKDESASNGASHNDGGNNDLGGGSDRGNPDAGHDDDTEWTPPKL